MLVGLLVEQVAFRDPNDSGTSEISWKLGRVSNQELFSLLWLRVLHDPTCKSGMKRQPRVPRKPAVVVQTSLENRLPGGGPELCRVSRWAPWHQSCPLVDHCSDVLLNLSSSS
jgi:hypothetical protein